MRKKRPQHTVISYGEILWDIFPEHIVLGGAPLNLACRVHSLGERAVIASRLGRDQLGNHAFALAAALGADTSCIQWDERYPTGTVQVSFSPAGEPDYLIVPGVAYDCIEVTDKLLELCRKAAVFSFGTLVQRSEKAGKTLASLLEAAAGSLKFLDINLRRDCFSETTVRWSLEKADILKLNADEVRTVSSMLFGGELEADRFCRKAVEKFSLRCCLVTLGAGGVLAAERAGKLIYIPGYAVEVVDTVGAGDAFSAGFIHARLEGKDLARCCELGNLLGALAAGKKGATAPISEEEIDGLRTGVRDRLRYPGLESFAVA